MTVLNGLLVLFASLWRVAGHQLFAPSALPAAAAAVLAAAVLTVVLVALVATCAGVARTAIPLVRRTTAFREKSWRAAFLRQRDPDADGRTRPRAPTAAPAAA
ncbi:MAG: hypothetical protein JOY82_15155 [Streptosporangiaceae bacterium]|nr:hypothetical protein [Streptosporangiaceae bacterium]MBV9855829.1 hypothetical protein [Streptosporangiaceae bacterium]